MSGYKGMRWFKCDLHVHTPQERHWIEDSSKVRADSTPERRIEAARNYLRRCHQVRLEVISVVDHNFATRPADSFIHFLRQENRYVAEELRKEMIHILPGFEVEANVGRGVHVLSIFDRDTPLEVVDSRLGELGLGYDSRFERDGRPRPAVVNLSQILDVVQRAPQNPGLVIAAHPFATNGLLDDETCENWLQIEEFTNPELHCIEIPKPKERLPAGYRQLLASGESCDVAWRRVRPVACILSSDAYRLRPDAAQPGNHLGYRHTWIKMTEPSIIALRQAFLDHESRIAFGDRSPDEDRRHGRIVSLAIRGASYLADQTVYFAPGLTCLIGGRGSGKSTILEYLRIGLRRDDAPSEAARAQNARLKNTLSVGSDLEIHWSSESGVADTFGVTNHAAGGEVQIRGRDAAVADPVPVFEQLGVTVLSQRQVTELAQESALLKFVDGLIARRLAPALAESRASASTVEDLLTKNAQLASAVTELNTLQGELDELNRQWNARAEIQDEAAAQKLAARKATFLTELSTNVFRSAELLRNTTGELGQIAPPLSEDDSTGLMADVSAVGQAAQTLHQSLIETVSAAVQEFEVAMQRITDGEQVVRIRESITAAQTAFQQACEQRGLLAQDIERMRELGEQIQTKTTQKNAKAREVEQLTAQGLEDAITHMHAAWRAEFDARRDAIGALCQTINSGRRFLDPQVTFQGSAADFAEKCWKRIVPDGRSRLGRSWDELGKAALAGFVASGGGGSVWDFVSNWIAGVPAEELEEFDDLRDDLRQHLIAQRAMWDRVRTCRFADKVDFVLLRRDGTPAGSLSDGKLSEGQRNTIVLSLLLAEGNGPIVIDQPEDELDSDFVFNELVPVVRDRKKSRQIIFVTHNANLAVNADADLVYALRFSDGQGRLRAQGGLDVKAASQAVLEIMEGSEAAFQRRREKYHF